MAKKKFDSKVQKKMDQFRRDSNERANREDPVTVPTPKTRKTGTPSPKVIASVAIKDAITGLDETAADDFGLMCSTKVSEAKRIKVIEQIEKISRKFLERLTRTIDKHYGK